jgi:hypothetical protein
MTRGLITDAFKIPTFSVYDEPGAVERHQMGQRLQGRYSELKKAAETYIIKTHGYVGDDSQVIKIIRNGRDAVASLARYYKIANQHAITGEGVTLPGWTAFNRAWEGRGIQLRYEEIVSDPMQAAKKIGKLIGIEPKESGLRFDKSLGGSKGKIRPNFNEKEEELFQRCHGQLMRELGYK